MIWIRDGLEPTPTINTVIFDVDGVLIDDAVSYHATVKAVVQHVVTTLYGHPNERGRVTDADILAFKAAGGFNDDWLLSYTLCGIALARNGATPPLVQIAAESEGRGMTWVRERYFSRLVLEFEVVERVCMEYYWGTELLQERLGLNAQYYRGPGFVNEERSLVPLDFFDQLRAINVVRFGLITGRNDIELLAGLQTLGLANQQLFGYVVDSTQIRKPDPAALLGAMTTLKPSRAVYIGDTGDDLQLVLNYRQSVESGTPCLAIIVAKPGQREHFAGAGADIVLDRTIELPAALQRITSNQR